ncbi:MAG: hypothetical protein JOZ69_07260, partial [Myxococcales bacterium]|nr:hypothetical protein [Myxococcales bacterium]
MRRGRGGQGTRMMLLVVLAGCGNGTVHSPPDAAAPDASAPDAGAPEGGQGDGGQADGGSPDGASPDAASTATQVNLHFDRASWLSAPFPSDDLRRADGTIDLGGFPNPGGSSFVAGALQRVASDAHGYSLTGSIFLCLTGAVDPSGLPTLAKSVDPASPVFLLGVDDQAPDFLRRYPVDVQFAADGGPFGAPNLLSVAPLQGVPLRPGTLYAAVVLKRLGDAGGAALGASPEMALLADGQRPSSLSAAGYASYTRALAALRQANVDPHDVAGLAAFTTDTPEAALALVRGDVLSRPLPSLDAPFTLTDTFDRFCVYQSTLAMPEYQEGQPPYAASGGGWAFDASGSPVVQRTETARIVLTVPRAAVPASGFPVTVFIRAGGGGDRPLVDRGVHAVAGGPPVTPGTGPAFYFAGQGIAGISVDGPLGGMRNATGGDEDTLLFNVANAAALRDNLRQSAVELDLLAHLVPSLTVDASGCPGVVGGPATLDGAR